MRERKLKRAMKKISKELLAMPREELLKELEKQEDTEVFKLLKRANFNEGKN